MSQSALSEQFASRGRQLPGPAELDATRRAALTRFAAVGLPNRRIESWHYTDLGAIADKDFDYLAGAPDRAALDRAAAALAGLKLDAQAPVCVFVDGHLIEALSSPATAAGLTIASLADTPADLLGAPGKDETALVALNTAFASGGARIRASGSCEWPLELVFIGARAGIAQQYRLAIELAAGARLSAIQHFVDAFDTGEAWLNVVADVEQGEASELALYRLQQHGSALIHTSLTRARLRANASFTAAAVELGGKLVRNEIELSLAGPEARADIRGLALTRDSQHCDTRIAIEHKAPRTSSRQAFRAIADGRSKSIFNGKVTVCKDAQHIDARQRNDNLLLSPQAEIDTKPELEIYADQVACSHGATVGELSEQQLFYLRSRGIAAESARRILTAAFADVILATLELDAFRDCARQAVSGLLPRPNDGE